jgi:cytochrome c oxidase assembly protein subunit 15
LNSSADLIPAHRKAIQAWLLIVAALIFAMVMVGGATRLTESGLSIVEWKPVTGVVPPLSEAQWQGEFVKYQAIPQFRFVKPQMTLDEFKTIYLWEWTHRTLGRLLGIVFLFPFLWFLWRGMIEPGLRLRLWLIFTLGAAQGVIGWWMVASGLVERVDVSQYRLAVHLTLACILFAAVLWTATALTGADRIELSSRRRRTGYALVGLVLLQIYLGALVAGLDAGLIYNSWPLIDGSLVPPASELFALQPWWRNFFEHRLTVQFDHRIAAYLLWGLAVWHAADIAAAERARAALGGALFLAGALTLQAVLGVITLLYQAPMGLALMHQAMAVVVLGAAVIHAARLRAEETQPRLESVALSSSA